MHLCREMKRASEIKIMLESPCKGPIRCPLPRARTHDSCVRVSAAPQRGHGRGRPVRGDGREESARSLCGGLRGTKMEATAVRGATSARICICLSASDGLGTPPCG